jgi:CheY-like chemotaxis protein
LADLEEDVEALESIYQCGLVQERIAGDVLSLARIQLDMLSLHFVEMDLRKEAKKVLSVFASEAKMKKIEIVLELGGSLEALQIRGIKTDPVRLGQVLTNLTANAIRFTAAAETRRITVHYEVGLEPPLPGTLVPPPNMPFPIVTPLSEDTPLYLYVSVTDTGPGMTPDEQKMLFKRFQQSNKMIHTRYGGSGLGLFICKKIVELLGGAIAVESEIDVGSVFRFWIKTHTVAPADLTSPSVSPSPLPIPAPQTLRVGSMESTAAEPPSPQPVQQAIPAEPPEALRLLIVEDNIINQTVLKRQLVKAGFVCDTANDGQEALVRIHEANRECRHDTPGQLGGYDIVLMDLEMPVMDGLTAIRHIRDAERRGILRPQLVIALTGNARQGQIDQARAAGMDDVIIKPYRLPALIATIRAACQSHRERWAQDSEWPDVHVRVNEQMSAPSPRPASPSYDTNAQGHAVLSEANVARLGSKRRPKARSPRQGINGGHPLPEPVPASAGDMARELTDS